MYTYARGYEGGERCWSLPVCVCIYVYMHVYVAMQGERKFLVASVCVYARRYVGGKESVRCQCVCVCVCVFVCVYVHARG